MTFEQQLATLVRLGYPELLGIGEPWFRRRLEPLRELAAAQELPAVLVFPQELIPIEAAMARTMLGSRCGITRLEPVASTRFRPLPELGVPDAPYLLLGPDRGSCHRDQPPDQALELIRAAGLTPLTIEEGIAWLTHDPEALQRNHCFSLAGSRCGDRRVPALWISQGHPRLGWCWAGNPHAWLGTATARGRCYQGTSDQAGRSAGS